MNAIGATGGERGGKGDDRAVARVTTGPEMSVLLDELERATGGEKAEIQELIAALVKDLLGHATAGGRSALPALRVFVERRPNYLGRMDIAGYATRALVAQAAAGDVFLAELFTREIERVRDDLAGASPTPLERLMAERVALTWFDATDADTRLAANAANPNAEYYGRYRERANRRFSQAARALATIRKLARPDIRINVAENQVNVG